MPQKLGLRDVYFLHGNFFSDLFFTSSRSRDSEQALLIFNFLRDLSFWFFDTYVSNDKKTQTLLVLQQQNSIFLLMIHFHFFKITFVYKECDVNNTSLTWYCDISVETAKFICKESQSKNKDRLYFPWVNHAWSWDLLLNLFRKTINIILPSFVYTEKNNIFLKVLQF